MYRHNSSAGGQGCAVEHMAPISKPPGCVGRPSCEICPHPVCQFHSVIDVCMCLQEIYPSIWIHPVQRSFVTLLERMLTVGCCVAIVCMRLLFIFAYAACMPLYDRAAASASWIAQQSPRLYQSVLPTQSGEVCARLILTPLVSHAVHGHTLMQMPMPDWDYTQTRMGVLHSSSSQCGHAKDQACA